MGLGKFVAKWILRIGQYCIYMGDGCVERDIEFNIRGR